MAIIPLDVKRSVPGRRDGKVGRVRPAAWRDARSVCIFARGEPPTAAELRVRVPRTPKRRLEVSSPTPATPVSAARPPLIPGRIVVLVRDYDAALAFYQEAFGARVEAAGGRVVHPLRSADGARFAHVADLFGSEFVLVELGSPAP